MILINSQSDHSIFLSLRSFSVSLSCFFLFFSVPPSLFCSVPGADVSPTEKHTMGGDSSASALDPQAANDVPLIWCTDCGTSRVVRRISQKPWSLGQVFYCCPKHKVSVQLQWMCVQCIFFTLAWVIFVARWQWLSILVLGRRLSRCAVQERKCCFPSI